MEDIHGKEVVPLVPVQTETNEKNHENSYCINFWRVAEWLNYSSLANFSEDDMRFSEVQLKVAVSSFG